MDNLFTKTLKHENDTGCPPIWFMRQAGRYHHHYQNLRRQHSFLEICKNPEIATEAAMGPIRDFDFDAAILFSDILFPIEAMGIGLDFAPGPTFDKLLREPEDLKSYKPVSDVQDFFGFQGESLRQLRKQLPESKGMIGFVGGLFTNYFFAVEGTGKGDAASALSGLKDGRFDGFMERLVPMLIENMAVQAEAGIDVMAILDSSISRLSEQQFADHYIPFLKELTKGFNERYPDIPILYYTLGVETSYWKHLNKLPIRALGVDHSHFLPMVMPQFGGQYAIQGNFAPDWIAGDTEEFVPRLEAFVDAMASLPDKVRTGWICGLGHGILPHTPEEHVKIFVKTIRERFSA